MINLRTMILRGGNVIIKCVFSDDMIRQPILYELGNRFEVVTNIKKARITPDLGWVIVELMGDVQEVEKSLEWLNQIGVKVERLEKEDKDGKS